MLGNGAPQPGDVLGNYVLKRLLGTGGMGLVYLAEHERLHRKVALKLLRPELTQDPVSVRRFFAEARAVNEIGHDNIVEVTDFVDQGEHRYFVMELLKGHSLGDVLMQGRLPLARTMHIARQIADALAAAHDAGVVHRDLKPQNVFLIKRGMDADFVKVLDFGIAKVRGMEGEVDQTAAGTFVGTPAYMAPEQLANKLCDHRVDVYAFGVLFFELVTGVRPFRATNMAEIIVQQLTMPAPKPSVVLRENGGSGVVPDKLERFLLALLEKNPDKRVQSMRDVLNVIEEIVPLVAGTSAGVGSMPPQGRHVDTSGEYALPSAAGGWMSVNKDSPALTTGEGFVPAEEPEFANLDDVIDASADAQPADATKPSSAPKATPKAAAPISFAPLPPLPAFAPLPTLPPLGRAPTPFAPTTSSKLDDGSSPLIVGRPITESGALLASPASAKRSNENFNGDFNGDVNAAFNAAFNGNGDYANTTLGGDSTLGGNPLDVSAPHAALDGVVPAIVPRTETSPTMAHVDANLSPDLLASVDGTAPRSKRGLAIAAAAAIAVVVIVAVVMSSGDPVASDAPPGTPADTPVVVAPTPPDTPPSTPPDTPPDTPPEAVTPPEAPINTPRKGRVMVDVSFTSKPAGATVVMGGKTLGVTPFTAKVPESSRGVPVSFKLDGHEPKTVSATMASGSTVTAALVEVKKDEPKSTVKDGALINPFKKKPK